MRLSIRRRSVAEAVLLGQYHVNDARQVAIVEVAVLPPERPPVLEQNQGRDGLDGIEGPDGRLLLDIDPKDAHSLSSSFFQLLEHV